MASKLLSRPTIRPGAVDRRALVVLPETAPPDADASAEAAVADWRVALADYLKALQELGDAQSCDEPDAR